MCKIPAGFKWSFSKLEAYAHCPMMFKLQYLDKVEQDENAYSQYGSYCHSLLEQWAKNKLPCIALAEVYDEGFEEAVTASFPPFPKGTWQKYYEQGHEYFANFDGFGDQYEILAVEEKFEVDIGGYPFVGIVDLVLRDKTTGEITVIDHKSKSSATMEKDLPTYRKQLYIYALFVKEKWGAFPKYLKFNLFRENKWVEEEFDNIRFSETMKWVVDTIENILFETDWLVSTSSFFCRFICGVLDACPAKETILYPPQKERTQR